MKNVTGMKHVVRMEEQLNVWMDVYKQGVYQVNNSLGDITIISS